jgi:hypothetical protein
VSGARRNVTEPSTQDKPDDGTCIPQSGAEGFDITVTRVFKDPGSGAEIRRERFATHYIPEAIIHCIPPASGDQQPGTDGTTPPATPTTGGRRPERLSGARRRTR